jgi:hypothetical protein
MKSAFFFGPISASTASIFQVPSGWNHLARDGAGMAACFTKFGKF